MRSVRIRRLAAFLFHVAKALAAQTFLDEETPQRESPRPELTTEDCHATELQMHHRRN